MKEYIKGGKAEGKDCKDIAELHGVPLADIEKQEKMGTKIEYEHTPDSNIAAEIARDHLTEFPYYYDFLEEMETKAKTDYKKKGYGKKKDKEDPGSEGEDDISDKKELEDVEALKKARLKKLFG